MKRKSNIITICYGHTQYWTSRTQAMEYFAEGAMCCEGSEAERYAKIFFQLKHGKKIATDE